MTDFYQLTPGQQIEKLETLAHKALESWAINQPEIWLLKYRENCVFGVRDTLTDTRYALRIHRPGYHNKAALHSELQWMVALHDEGVHTPDVIHSRDGELSLLVEVEGVPEARVCDVLSWVEGEVLGKLEGGSEASAEEVKTNYTLAGKIAAQIHNQAQSWIIPEGFVRPMMDGPGFVGEKGYLGDFRQHPHLSEEQRILLSKAADAVSRDLEGFGKTPDRFGLTHADFLPENLLLNHGDLRIIDFDDCGFGWYIMDIATAVFPLLGEENFDPAFEGMVEGYRSNRDLPDSHLKLLEVCFLARLLSYLAWVTERQETQEFVELSPVFISAAVELAEGYMK